MLQGDFVYVRFFEEDDVEELLDFQVCNREFFQAYVSTRDESFYTREGQQDFIRTQKEKIQQDQRYAFGIFEKETDKLIGSVMLSEVLRGSLQSCFIGYYLDQEYNGKGYTTEAVRLVVSYAFNELKLHRIEAGVMPHNIRSMRVLEKVGFHKEGIARKNVKINGKWEDHQVLAIINEND